MYINSDFQLAKLQLFLDQLICTDFERDEHQSYSNHSLRIVL